MDTAAAFISARSDSPWPERLRHLSGQHGEGAVRRVLSEGRTSRRLTPEDDIPWAGVADHRIGSSSAGRGRAFAAGSGRRNDRSAGSAALRLLSQACFTFTVWVCSIGLASAQTPSPLQEWQFAGGVILQKVFEPNVPEWRSVLGAAAAWKPIYDGARPYVVQLGPVLDVRYRDIAFVSIGEGLGINLLRGDSYRAGLALGYDLGRRVSQYPSHLNGLGDMSPAPAFKLFGAYAVSKDFPAVLRVDVRAIVGGADGVTADLSAYMPLPGSSRTFIMFAGPSLSLAGGGYMQNVFGVSANQSISSGYRRFIGHAGVKSLGFGFSATWFVTDHWLFNADTAVERLLGAAAESPITQAKVEGIVALSVGYRW